MNFGKFQRDVLIQYKGKTGVILMMDHEQDCAVIKYLEDNESCTYKPSDLTLALKNQELVFIEEKKSKLLSISSVLVAEIKRRNAYVIPMSEDDSPCSVETRTLISKEVSESIHDTKAHSISALYRYYKTWQADGYDMALQVIRDSESRSFTKNFVEDLFTQYYFKKVKQNSKQTTKSIIKNFKKWAQKQGYGVIIKSEEQIRRYEKRLPRLKVIKKKHGKSAARDAGRGAYKLHEADYPLQQIQMDAMHASIGILDDNGYYLGKVIIYLVMDVYSRAILGYAIQIGKGGECSGGVVHAIRYAVEPKVDPDYIMCGFIGFAIIDNGSAYTAEVSRNCFSKLCSGIEPTFVKKGDGKPHVERFISTLRTQFFCELPGYLGKRDGKTPSDTDIKSSARMTITQFKKQFADYIIHDYHKTDKKSLDGCTPYDVWKMGIESHPPMLPVDVNDLNLLKGIKDNRVLHEHNGVEMNVERFNSPELQALYHELHGNKKKHRVEVDILYDPLDASSISIIDPRDESLIDVPNVKQLLRDISFNELTVKRKSKRGTVTPDVLISKPVMTKVRKKKSKPGKKVPLESELKEKGWNSLMQDYLNEGNKTVRANNLKNRATVKQDGLAKKMNDICDNVEASDEL